MKRKNNIFIIAMVAIFLFAGCRTNKSDQVELGAIIPLTGYASSVGTLFQHGLELAVEELNHDSVGISFNVNLEDSKSSPKDALMAYRKLESMGVKYFLGFGGQFVLHTWSQGGERVPLPVQGILPFRALL